MGMDKERKTNEEFEVDGIKKKRQKCEIYTRCMGYLRNVSNFNIWKKTEFYSRKYFDISKTCPRVFDRIQTNRDFILKYTDEKATQLERTESTPYSLTM